MRILNIVLAAFMALFAAAQYNDPDGPLWMAFYAVPTLWAGIAGWKPALLQAPTARAGLAICLAIYLVLTFLYWPTDADWWQIEVWWESEAAREGMGLMIASAVIAVAGLSALIGPPRPAAAGRRT